MGNPSVSGFGTRSRDFNCPVGIAFPNMCCWVNVGDCSCVHFQSGKLCVLFGFGIRGRDFNGPVGRVVCSAYAFGCKRVPAIVIAIALISKLRNPSLLSFYKGSRYFTGAVGQNNIWCWIQVPALALISKVGQPS